jgi:hypothetical protein
MTVIAASLRELVDREIMLTCLAAAAEEGCAEDFRPGERARRVLDVRLESARTRRRAAALRAQSRARRASPSPQPRPRPEVGVVNRVAMGRLMLDLRRAELLAHREDAADLRASACALRAEAQQARRRAMRP